MALGLLVFEAPMAVAAESPVAAYSFDEGEGATVEDLTGNGHDATIEGATWAKGRYGGALHFDGENDCVSIPGSPAFQFLADEELTFEAWVRPSKEEQLSAVITQEDEGFDEETEEAPYAYTMLAGAGEGGRAWLRKAGEFGHVSVAGGETPGNTWTHIAATDDGAHLRLFVDGELVNTEDSIPLTAAEGPLSIGCLDAFGNYFEGRIDEVRIYDRALEAGEIVADRATPIETPRQSPIAAYSFDEGEGSTLHDLTGNGHDATIEGATWAKGRYGGALHFDGENDCVSIPESAQLQFTEDEELTFEAWVRPSKEEELSAILTQEDEGANEEVAEAHFVYSMLTGAGEAPNAWVRKAGETGHVSIGGGETPGNAWTHIAFTDDGAHLRFYVDGELIDTQPAIPLTAAEGPLTIGCLDAFGNYFEGRIDEVRIYDRALDGGEVAADRATPIETPQQSPIAVYSFDEGEGSTLHDLTGNGHDGAIEGAAWTRGRYGGALEFDGENDCVSAPSSLDLNLAEEFTLEAWVRPGSSREFTPIFLREGGAEESYSLYLGAFDAGQLEGFVVDESPGFAEVDSGEALPNNAWSHVAMTSDGNRLRLYLDGQLLDTASAREALESEGDLYLGCFPGQEQFFEGRIDEVRIYNRALDADELGSDRETPIQTPHRDPVAAYSFDEGEGATVEDLTGNGHDATIEGATWAKGRYGGALHFDGENDCVSIPGSPAFQFLADEELTFEAWVRPSKEEQLSAVITQEDEGFDEETEEAPYAYSMLTGGAEEGPRAWFRKGGEFGHVGVGGGETPGNAWTHIAVTDDGAKLRFYVDGELLNTEDAIPLTAAEGPLTIGCLDAFGNYFEGRIDEVRIYDRALSEGELRQTMNAGFPKAITEAATEVEANDAILTGVANANGGETEYFFEYGPTKSYGSTVVGEELGSDREAVEISEAIIDLSPETTYHYRLVANSPAGTAYGKDQTLATTERTMTVEEEEELMDAEDKLDLIASESKAGPGGFYGMMWTGKLENMRKENTYEAIENSGAKMLRFAVYPGDQTEIDKAFDEAAKHDLTVLPYLGSGAFPKAGTELRASWIKYAKELMKKYGPDSSFSHPVKAWEIWNEPNMPFGPADHPAEEEGAVNPEAFAGFFKEMSEALRSASEGGIQVLAPGLYGYRVPGCHPACHLTPRAFLNRMDKRLSELAYGNAYDAMSLHPYVFKIGDRPGRQHAPKDEGDVKRASIAIKRVISGVHKLHKEKPLWVTELGFPVANPGNKAKVPPVTNPTQKLLVKASYAMMQNNRNRLNIAHAFYYNIQDTSQPGWEYHSGLLTLKGNMRPAWSAFSGLAGGKICPHPPC